MRNFNIILCILLNLIFSYAKPNIFVDNAWDEITHGKSLLSQEDIRENSTFIALLEELKTDEQNEILQSFTSRVIEGVRSHGWPGTLWLISCTEMTLLNLENLIILIHEMLRIEYIGNKKVIISWYGGEDLITFYEFSIALELFSHHAHYFDGWTYSLESRVYPEYIAADFKELIYPYAIAATLWRAINLETGAMTHVKEILVGMLRQFGTQNKAIELVLFAIVNMVDGFRFWPDPLMHRSWSTNEFKELTAFFTGCETVSEKSLTSYHVPVRLNTGKLLIKEEDMVIISSGVDIELNETTRVQTYAHTTMQQWLEALFNQS
jgi:hypothetical protein